MIPGSLLLMEENVKRRKALRIFLIAGAVLSSYYAICLIIFKVTPKILNCHINYGGAFIPSLMIPAFLLYQVVTLIPLFISGVKGMRWLGVLMFLAVVVTVIFYVKNVTSVWCFFAAIISVVIYRMIRHDPPPKGGLMQ
jgi:hypothetical protein